MPGLHIRVSLPQQTLELLDGRGGLLRRYSVSTASNGAGELSGSHCTPRGTACRARQDRRRRGIQHGVSRAPPDRRDLDSRTWRNIQAATGCSRAFSGCRERSRGAIAWAMSTPCAATSTCMARRIPPHGRSRIDRLRAHAQSGHHRVVRPGAALHPGRYRRVRRRSRRLAAIGFRRTRRARSGFRPGAEGAARAGNRRPRSSRAAMCLARDAHGTIRSAPAGCCPTATSDAWRYWPSGARAGLAGRLLERLLEEAAAGGMTQLALERPDHGTRLLSSIRLLPRTAPNSSRPGCRTRPCGEHSDSGFSLRNRR
jgi:hypothetical protein